jgi:hypothetical protein
MGLTGVTASIWHHMGMLLVRLGDPKTALARAESALDAFTGQGDKRAEANARLYRAFFLAQDDDLERAASEARVAVDASISMPPLRAYALAVLGRVLLQDARPHQAEEPARDAMNLLDALGGIEEGESFVRLTFAETLDAIGDHDGACDAIRDARVRLLERAANIRDETWKVSFLEKVGENARTFELARDWRVAER